ncbi:ubiquinone biosynthesis monooxygenase COQ6 [Phycomyces blakesleeanus]
MLQRVTKKLVGSLLKTGHAMGSQPGMPIALRSIHSSSCRRASEEGLQLNEKTALYDIVIVGGGVAGTALACALASNPVLRDNRVALVEAMDLTSTIEWSPVKESYSNRVVSLTPGSMNFFERMGVVEHMDLSRVHGYGDMEVWDGVTDARIKFDTSLLGSKKDTSKESIAYMVENIHLQNAMLKRIRECNTRGAQVDILQKARVASIGNEQSSTEFDVSDWPSVKLESGDVLQTRLLIGADGVNSPVRNYANIESLGWDYDTHGVVATLKLDDSRPNNTAWQRFLPTGPIAMLPLSEGYASLVWSTKPEIAKILKGVSSDDFCKLVNAAFRMSTIDLNYLYGAINKNTFIPECDIGLEYTWREEVANKSKSTIEVWQREESLPPAVVSIQDKSRASFPLRMRNSERYVADRVALVGDAAHAIHPLAGQGLNQGMLDVACLSKVLEKGTLEGQDIGKLNLLRDYAAERYGRNIVMLSACDKMHRLFGTDVAPVTWIRSLGLSAVNSSDSLKAEIMKYAMGVESSR